jgi:hypothetical protein
LLNFGQSKPHAKLRSGPISTKVRRSKKILFDHLVGAREQRRCVNAEKFRRRLHADHMSVTTARIRVIVVRPPEDYAVVDWSGNLVAFARMDGAQR